MYFVHTHTHAHIYLWEREYENITDIRTCVCACVCAFTPPPRTSCSLFLSPPRFSYYRPNCVFLFFFTKRVKQTTTRCQIRFFLNVVAVVDAEMKMCIICLLASIDAALLWSSSFSPYRIVLLFLALISFSTHTPTHAFHYHHPSIFTFSHFLRLSLSSRY